MELGTPYTVGKLFKMNSKSVELIIKKAGLKPVGESPGSRGLTRYYEKAVLVALVEAKIAADVEQKTKAEAQAAAMGGKTIDEASLAALVSAAVGEMLNPLMASLTQEAGQMAKRLEHLARANQELLAQHLKVLSSVSEIRGVVVSEVGAAVALIKQATHAVSGADERAKGRSDAAAASVATLAKSVSTVGEKLDLLVSEQRTANTAVAAAIAGASRATLADVEGSAACKPTAKPEVSQVVVETVPAWSKEAAGAAAAQATATKVAKSDEHRKVGVVGLLGAHRERVEREFKGFNIRFFESGDAGKRSTAAALAGCDVLFTLPDLLTRPMADLIRATNVGTCKMSTQNLTQLITRMTEELCNEGASTVT